jgi:hypothetical protein
MSNTQGDFNQLGDSGLNTATGANPTQNEHGQGLSHATDPNASKVPNKVQEKVPKGLEDSLPDKVIDSYTCHFSTLEKREDQS